MLPMAIYWGYTVSFLYSSAPQSHLPCEGLRVYMFVHTLINFAPNDPKFNVACIDVICLLHESVFQNLPSMWRPLCVYTAIHMQKTITGHLMTMHAMFPNSCGIDHLTAGGCRECHSSAANEDGYDILWYRSGTLDRRTCLVMSFHFPRWDVANPRTTLPINDLNLVSPVYQGWWTQESYQACTTTSSLKFTSKNQQCVSKPY